VIQTTSLPTLHFLPSGKLPSSSLGILNSPQMKEFIQDVKRVTISSFSIRRRSWA
jgi:polysaccharide biosynthesis transport protein